MEDVAKKTIHLAADHFGVTETEITPDMDMRSDLSATDLEIADFYTLLEREFGITIPTEDVNEFHTLQDVISYLSDNEQDFTQAS